jgi:hypothetical protein
VSNRRPTLGLVDARRAAEETEGKNDSIASTPIESFVFSRLIFRQSRFWFAKMRFDEGEEKEGNVLLG